MKFVLEPLEEIEGYIIDGTIVLQADLYPPRRNWIFCHELAHLILKHPEESMIRREMEFEADALASELMLPTDDFRNSMRTMDMVALKEKFGHASWEAVARRWANEQHAVLTIYDNGKLVRRIRPENLACPYNPLPAEIKTAQECWELRKHLTRDYNSENEVKLELQAFFVDEGRGVARVLLLTIPIINDFDSY